MTSRLFLNWRSWLTVGIWNNLSEIRHSLKERRIRIFMVSFFLVSALVIWGFYTTSVRDVSENFLHDIRTKLKPDLRRHNKVVLLTFGSDFPTAPKSGHGSLLSKSALATAIRDRVMPLKPSLVLVTYFSNLFDYAPDDDESDIVNLVSDFENIGLLTLQLHTSEPSLQIFSSNLAVIRNSLVGGDLGRKRSNSIVRAVPRFAYLDRHKVPMAAEFLQQRLNPKQAMQGDSLRINYFEARRLPQFNLLRDQYSFADIEGKVVIVGYDSYRMWLNQTPEPILVNTPLHGNQNNFDAGSRYADVMGVLADNVANATWLRDCPTWVNVLQTFVVSASIFATWSIGSFVGSIGTLVIAAILLLFHGVLMETAYVEIPLADTFLFATLSMLLGAFFTLGKIIGKYAALKISLANDQEMEKLQSRFLERFATEVTLINSDLRVNAGALLSHCTDPIDRELVTNLQLSAQEFEEFLGGITQIASAGKIAHSSRKDSQVNILKLAERIVSRCKKDIDGRQPTISISIDPNLSIPSNPEILDAIIYNFLSNALKYAADSANITLYATSDGDIVRIGVKDQGQGIPKDLQERIFEKFYRIKNDQVYRIKGSGMGLYLVKYFAEQIHAKIGVDSQIDVGSDFYIEVSK